MAWQRVSLGEENRIGAATRMARGMAEGIWR
jgi:hypothetical protein